MFTSRPSYRLIALLTLSLVGYAAPSHAAIIGLALDSPVATNGESVTLDITAGDLGNFSPDSLGAFDVTVGYDASLLSFTGYSLGEFLGDLATVEAIDAGSGDSGSAVNVAEVSLLPSAVLHGLQPGAFVLASLVFDVINLDAGSSTEFSILPGALLASTAGTPIQFTGNLSAALQGGTPVPLPGTPLLLLCGLVCSGLVNRLRGLSSKV